MSGSWLPWLLMSYGGSVTDAVLPSSLRGSALKVLKLVTLPAAAARNDAPSGPSPA